MFYQDVLSAVTKKSLSTLEELFKRPVADPNAREYVDYAGKPFGENLLCGVIRELSGEKPEDMIIFHVDYLLKKGASINLSMHGKTALNMAVLYNLTALTKFMISRGAEVNVDAFCSAAQKGYIDILKLFINQKFDVNARDQNGFTALMKIFKFDVASNHKETVQCLLEAGAEISNVVKIYAGTSHITALSQAYNYLLSDQDSPKSKSYTESIQTAFELLLESARKYIFDMALQMMKKRMIKNKIRKDEFYCEIKTLVLGLSGHHSIDDPASMSNNCVKAVVRFQEFQKLLLAKVFEPVWHALKERDDLLFSFCSGSHARLGSESSLTWLYQNEIYDSNLLSMVFEFADRDHNPFGKMSKSYLG